MEEQIKVDKGSAYLKKLLQYFFQGIIIIAPIGITLYVVLWLFNMVDDILPGILHHFFPKILGLDEEGAIKKIPGIGFLFVVGTVMLIGRISSSFIVSRLVDIFDSVLERTPGIKYIYTSVKDFLEAFGGHKRKFEKPVLANVDANNVWRIGFITQEDAAHFNLNDHVVVYVPLSYALTGVVYIVPKENIKPLDHIGAAEAMKFAISGGVTHVD